MRAAARTHDSQGQLIAGFHAAVAVEKRGRVEDLGKQRGIILGVFDVKPDANLPATLQFPLGGFRIVFIQNRQGQFGANPRHASQVVATGGEDASGVAKMIEQGLAHPRSNAGHKV